MSINIDINTAKQYNEALKKASGTASQLEAQRDFMQKEIESLCRELSAEIGETVTIENAEAVLEKYAEKINNTVNTGNIVLAKIESEINGVQTVAQPQAVVQPQATEIQAGTPVAPVVQTQTAVQQGVPQATQQAQATQVIETPVEQLGSVVSMGGGVGQPVNSVDLPPLFKMG